MTKQFEEGFKEAMAFVAGKVGASQPAREIYPLMQAELRRLKLTK